MAASGSYTPGSKRRAADPAHLPAGSRESEMRQRVLSATAELIDRFSYDDVTIDAVARASGVSKSTLYRHWPARRVLVLEAFTYKTNLLTHIEETGDVTHDLHAYLIALTRCLNEGKTASTVANLLAEAIRSKEFSGLYRQTLLRDRRHGFLAILERGQEQGQVRRDADLGTVVDALYGAVHHRLVATGEAISGPFLRRLSGLAVLGCATPDYLERRRLDR
ncbi:TetR/AcrR family transcriptional regulator [Pseudarthrobacter sp. NamE5]|uniref:TetR/AcrR family transcriptional regulator n=1 Tax=Pseudarthrobacter sp. NamE5 TaxID=2576839 RepID=UPI00110A7347|nr:TetR/AcrR family transcriptional regulator [Pseudarthrobacter sp. NamE5]TLM81806.1 TetR/AcrR family transcriptional regulator [Pseudarthrobacter sp. NamE5]